jgi:hypothetical protein
MIQLYFLPKTVSLTGAWMGTPTRWKRETLKSENGADPDINVQLVRSAIARLQAHQSLVEEEVKAQKRTPITVTPLKRTLTLVKL